MNFIAAHWEQLTLLAFMALAGVVLIVRGIQELRERRRNKPWPNPDFVPSTHGWMSESQKRGDVR